MPTSSGPNQKGEENLVFAYDVGDVKNSYIGEPTVNFITELGDPVQEIARGEFGQYFNLVPVFETHGLVPYTLSMEMKGNIPGQCLVYMQNGSYTKYGFIGSWVTLTTEWQRFVFPNLTPAGPNATWQANTPNDHRAMLATYTVYGSGRNPTIRNIQLEHGAHDTPFIAGTRSTVEGLIDLTGNSSIDLANVSFDSNAQMVFDGTNDYVDLGSDSTISPINQGWTAEYVFKTNSAGTLQHFNSAEADDFNANWLALLSSKLAVWDHGQGTWRYGDTVFSSNTWYHIAFIQESGTSMQFYVNGEPEGGDHTTFNWSSNYSALKTRYIGRYEYNGGYGRYFNGEMPVAKLYNKALTAQEVKQNYQQYKTRFNLS